MTDEERGTSVSEKMLTFQTKDKTVKIKHKVAGIKRVDTYGH